MNGDRVIKPTRPVISISGGHNTSEGYWRIWFAIFKGKSVLIARERTDVEMGSHQLQRDIANGGFATKGPSLKDSIRQAKESAKRLQQKCPLPPK